MEIIDISVPIRDGGVVYEGDPSVRIGRVAELAKGHIANVSWIRMGLHTGTHVDAPGHFIEGVPMVEDVPLAACIGPAWVVDATAVAGVIDKAALDGLDVPKGTERLLFKTRNSALWERDEFDASFVGLSADAAKALVARGLRLVGIDYLSIAPKADPTPTHRALLAARVVIVEGLNLGRVEAGAYELVCLPLLIPGSDGSPARAVLVRR